MADLIRSCSFVHTSVTTNAVCVERDTELVR
jgi:hypothetical protein